MGECVQNQIDLLPQSLRAVLVLFDLMELNHQEIADTLGISIENVKVRLHRARKKLKTILKEKCTFEKDERNVLVCNPIDCGPKECKGRPLISPLSPAFADLPTPAEAGASRRRERLRAGRPKAFHPPACSFLQILYLSPSATESLRGESEGGDKHG